MFGKLCQVSDISLEKCCLKVISKGNFEESPMSMSDNVLLYKIWNFTPMTISDNVPLNKICGSFYFET